MVALAASGFLSCTDAPVVPDDQTLPGFRITLRAEQGNAAGSAGGHEEALSQAFDRVNRFRIVLTRTSGEVAVDRTFDVEPGQDLYDLPVEVVLEAPDESFTAVITALDGHVVLFTSPPVTVTATSGHGGVPVSIPVEYAGPGLAAASVEIVPSRAIVGPGGARALSHRVLDDEGNPIPDVPVAWSTDASAVAQVSGTGLLSGVAEGITRVSVSTPTGLVASIPVYVVEGQVAFASQGQIFQGAVSASAAAVRTPGSTAARRPAWNPDGEGLFFEASGLIRQVGGGLELPGAWPSVSPDGSKLAVERSGRVWFVNADGSLPTAGPEGREPQWSGPAELVVSGGSVERVDAVEGTRETVAPGAARLPAAGPGGRLAYVLDDRLLVSDGGETASVLPSGLVPRSRPTWSPDGSWLVVSASRAGFPPVLHLVPSDGSAPPVPLDFQNTNEERDPAWRPTGPAPSPQPVVVESLDPGRPLPGEEVRVSGSGFDAIIEANNRVFFPTGSGPVAGELLEVTPTLLTVRAPEGITTGTLRVATFTGEGTLGVSPSVGGLVVVAETSYGKAVSGVDVAVLRNGSTVATGTTGEDGRATFSDLFTGSYQVAVTGVRDGFTASAPAAAQEVSLDATTTVPLEIGVEIRALSLETESSVVLEAPGSEAPAEALAIDVDGDPVPTASVEWTSSLPGVVEVVGTGPEVTLLGAAPGSAAVTASAGDFSVVVDAQVQGAVSGVAETTGGKGVSGSTVQAVLGGETVGTATTDEDGAFRLTGLPLGTLSVSVDPRDGFVLAQGQGPESAEVAQGAAEPELSFALEALVSALELDATEVTVPGPGEEVTLSAEARDVDGDPISDARIEWTTPDAEILELAPTEGTGPPVTGTSVRLIGVTPGDAGVTASADGAEAGASVRVLGGVGGTVTYDYGAPFPDAVLSLQRDGSEVARVTSDAQGAFRISGLELGAYELEVILEAGFRTVGPNPLSLTLVEGEAPPELLVEVDPDVVGLPVTVESDALQQGDTASASATPTDARGVEIPDAVVEWSPSDDQVLEVVVEDGGGSGGVQAERDPSQEVRVAAVGPGTAELVALSEGVETRTAISVAGAVNGRLVRPDGNPYTNGTIRLLQDGTEIRDPLSPADDGSFRFQSVDPGDYQVRVELPTGFEVRGTNPRPVTVGPGLDVLEFVILAGIQSVEFSVDVSTIEVNQQLSVTATPLDRNGEPVSVSSVRWSSLTPDLLSAQGTSLTGSLEGIAPSDEAGDAGFEIFFDNVPVAFDVTVTSFIEGTVVDVASQPLEGVTLDLLLGEGEAVAQTTISDAQGEFRFSGLLSGFYEVQPRPLGELTPSPTSDFFFLGSGVEEMRFGTASFVMSAANIESVVVTPEFTTLTAFEAGFDFDATVTDVNEATVDVEPAWSTGNTSVATVNAVGTVTAGQQNGSTSVIAEVGGVSGSATAVVDQAATSLDVQPSSLTLQGGETADISVTGTDANGFTVVPFGSSDAPTFVSNDPNTAAVTVTAGTTATIEGVEPGSTTIDVTWDGVTVSVPVTVGTNDPPVVSITEPADGFFTTPSTSVTFSGAATDPEDGDVSSSIQWSSSIDEVLGTGASITTTLSLGTHTITAVASDGSGQTGSASITVNVTSNEPPVVTIASPSDGSTFEEGQSVTLQGSATDPEDGALTGASLEWFLDGSSVGTGESVTTTLTTSGTVTVTLVATDSGGVAGQASITLNVLAVLSTPLSVNVPFGSTTQLPISLSEPAPAGGVDVSLTSSDPSVVGVAAPTVSIPAGALGANGTLEGVAPGTATITATAPGYNVEQTTATTTASLNIVQTSVEFPQFIQEPITIQLESGGVDVAAPAGGLTVDLASDLPGCVSVPSTVTIPEGLIETTVDLSYGGSASLSCSATVTASAPAVTPDNVDATVVQPGITVGNIPDVGGGLQVQEFAVLSTGNHGGITVTLQSSDPSLVILAENTSTEGSPDGTVDISIPDGQTGINYVVQALEGVTGPVTITATAPGFTDGSNTTTVVQPGFDLVGLGATKNSLDPNDVFQVRVGVPNGSNTNVFTQDIRAGATPLTVNVDNSDAAVGQLVTSGGSGQGVSAQIQVGQSQTPNSVANGGMAFDPLGSGTTSVVADIPGFTATSGATQTVTVSAPTITVGSIPDVGAGLQVQEFAVLESGDHGGITVTLQSSDPSLVILAENTSTEGTPDGTVDIFIPDGQTGINYVVQALEGVTGPVTITATAPGFTDGSNTTTVVQPGFDLVGLGGTKNSLDPNDVFQVRVGVPNGSNTNVFTQDIRAGGTPLTVNVDNSDAAVGQLVTSGGSGQGVSAQIQVGQSQTPNSVDAGGMAFDPLGEGTTSVVADIPGFTATSGATQTVTVSAPTITVGSIPDVGAGLQVQEFAVLESGDHGGITVTLQSSDPSLVILAENTSTEGTPDGTVDIFIPDGQTGINYVVQALEDVTGPVTITATAPGFTDGSNTTTVVQPGFDLVGLGGTKNSLDPNDVFQVRVGVPNSSNTNVFTQDIRAGGTPLTATVTNSQATVGRLVTSATVGQSASAQIQVGQSQTPNSVDAGGIAFDPLGSGTTSVVADILGFNATSGASQSVTVSAPTITVGNIPDVGAGLQVQEFAVLESGDHGGITVTLESSNPSVLVLAPDRSTVGQGSIDIPIPDGQTGINYVVQALEDVTGSVTISATAPGFSSGSNTARVVQPGLDIVGLDPTRTASDPDDPFQVRIGVPNSSNTNVFTQEIRAGGTTVTATITNSDGAVAQLVTSGATGQSVTIELGPLQSQSPSSVSAGGVALDPLAAGSTTVSAGITGFITTTGATRTVTIEP